ncbi:MAG: PQQ-dependent sugar dehydrogenase [Candidatus Limnocylindrales bacterium]
MPRRIPTAARALIPGLALALAIASQSALAEGPAATPTSSSAETALGAIAADRGAATSGPAVAAGFDATLVNLSLSKVAGNLSSPVFVTNAGDASGRLFIVEQGGRIKILQGGVVLAAPFLDIHTKVSKSGERGLLGLAFHPDYAVNGKFYVYYTDTKGRIAIAVYHRSTGDPNRASSTGSVLLRISKPYANHNGGTLAFGPDGYLYLGTGDGGSAGDPGNRAQDLGSLLGKILRINVNGRTSARPYIIPKTNPYVGKTGLDQIWARGVRNPWRFSFDSVTGDLWIGDVGQNRYEEIDRSTAASGGGRAKNYGWRVVEGDSCYRPATGCSKSGKKIPLAVYGHSKGCSVTGGYVYRGTEYSVLVGGYLFADFCSGRIWAVTAQGAARQTPRQLLDSTLMISSFGQAEDGSLYVTDLRNGGVWKVVAN